MSNQLKVTQTRSAIGRPEKHRKILKGLGLKGPHKSVVVDNTGMYDGVYLRQCWVDLGHVLTGNRSSLCTEPFGLCRAV